MGLSTPTTSRPPGAFDPKWLADVVNTLGSTGMAVGAFIAVVLDNIIPGTDEGAASPTGNRATEARLRAAHRVKPPNRRAHRR